MTIHEFGKENTETIVLVHPSAVMWDYFEYVIPLMEEHYHLVIPALPGYDPEESGDYTSVEAIAAELAARHHWRNRMPYKWHSAMLLTECRKDEWINKISGLQMKASLFT